MVGKDLTYIVDVVEDAFARALSENPHVIQYINQPLARQEYLCRHALVACRAIDSERWSWNTLLCKLSSQSVGKLGDLRCEFI